MNNSMPTLIRLILLGLLAGWAAASQPAATRTLAAPLASSPIVRVCSTTRDRVLLTADPALIMACSIQADVAGTVLILTDSSVRAAGATDVVLSLAVDGATRHSITVTPILGATLDGSESAALWSALRVPPGPHTVTLTANRVGQSLSLEAASMNLLYIPDGLEDIKVCGALQQAPQAVSSADYLSLATCTLKPTSAGTVTILGSANPSMTNQSASPMESEFRVGIAGPPGLPAANSDRSLTLFRVGTHDTRRSVASMTSSAVEAGSVSVSLFARPASASPFTAEAASVIGLFVADKRRYRICSAIVDHTTTGSAALPGCSVFAPQPGVMLVALSAAIHDDAQSPIRGELYLTVDGGVIAATTRSVTMEDGYGVRASQATAASTIIPITAGAHTGTPVIDFSDTIGQVTDPGMLMIFIPTTSTYLPRLIR
jgi:hypothetical protein